MQDNGNIVFPARAGMNRAGPDAPRWRACISRASGDEPLFGDPLSGYLEYFPRERG